MLTPAEYSKVLLHLGFSGTNSYASAAGPIVAQYPLRTLAELQATDLNAEGETRVRLCLTNLDSIESILVDALDRLAVDDLSGIKIRGTETRELEAEYRRWGYRLADTLGCRPNPYAERYRSGGMMAARA